MADYVTIDDYFNYECGWSPCLDNQQLEVSEIMDSFRHVLDLLDLKEARDSEWSYGYQCRGIVVERAGESWHGYDEWEPVPLGEEDIRDYHSTYDQLFIDVYNERFYPRMRAIWEWLDRKAWHLDRAATTGYWGDEYAHRKDKVLSERRERVTDSVYEPMVEGLCEALASEAEKLLEEACDYYESEQCAKEWVNDHGGVPISKSEVSAKLRGLGLLMWGFEVDNDTYDKVVNILGRYLEARNGDEVNDQELRLAVKLIAA